ADPDAPEWLQRLRDPATWHDGSALAELAASAPESRTVTLLVGLAERLHGAGQDCVAFLERVLKAHPGDFWANFALADAVGDKSPADAIRYYQAAVALRPEVAVA